MTTLALLKPKSLVSAAQLVALSEAKLETNARTQP